MGKNRQALEAGVKKHGFGVLHVHDLGTTLRNKGVDCKESCKVFEVCNPKQAAKVLSVDMNLNMALPCRVSVFTEKGQTKIGLIKPTALLEALSQDESLLVKWRIHISGTNTARNPHLDKAFTSA